MSIYSVIYVWIGGKEHEKGLKRGKMSENGVKMIKKEVKNDQKRGEK